MSKKREKHKNKENNMVQPPPPLFSINVATNIGKNFFFLLNECFPKNNKLDKIINKNTVN